VDTSDPEAVAKAFIVAVADKNIEEALQYVIPEERDAFRRDMEKGLPPFPKAPDIEVTVKGDRADVRFRDAKLNDQGYGLDMKRTDKKWWIVK